MKLRSVLSQVCAILFVALVSFSCSKSKKYEQIPDGVIVFLDKGDQDAQKIKLQVLSDNIIHVTATPVDSFSTVKSLMVIQDSASIAEWSVKEADNVVKLCTETLCANVSLLTGEVVFTDNAGKVILHEQNGGGKSFVQHEDKDGYYIRQVFESPDDEAFYGLGSHQNGQMNYKGDDVDLVQHNIVAVVPFLYSNRQYGLLWDNYSSGKFGDPREYEELSSLKLFSKDETEGGLTAQYFVGDSIKETKLESVINYEYLETPQVDSFPKDVSYNGKIIWEGSFTSDVEGDHKFLVYASSYFKVWIDDELILDKWRQNWNPWSNKFLVHVKSGEKHKIKIEWLPNGGFMAVKHLDPFPKENQNKLSMSFEVGDEINYYFIKGDNADDVISGYRKLTGKAPIVPKWAMGFWQSRERYRNQTEIVDFVKEYRKRNIPLDNIVLDWQYWEDPKWGSHDFDVTRFPDPAGMIKTIHDQLHANLMISVWPKFNMGTDNYEEMRRNGFLFMNNIEKGRKDWVGIGYQSTFYDPFNEGAGKLFWKQIDVKLNKVGVDAWWLDATEPDMHSNLSLDERKNNMSPTALGSGARYFNAYSLMNSKGVYEGQRNSSPDKRVFILTRSAYAGQQRYGAVTWSGDVVSRWSDLKDQIAAGINFSASGVPYWTMDIGGFAVEQRYEKPTPDALKEWRELNTRWFQYGAFLPIFRSHGQYPFREIFNISPEGTDVYKTLVFYDKLRYKLLPYYYSLAGNIYLKDDSFIRGLFMDFSNDRSVLSIGDQFMAGPALMICPVSTYNARTREVYFPTGAGWYDLLTGKYFDGGQRLEVAAPLNEIPVFVKAGSILPTGPDLQYSSEKPSDPTVLHVYTGQDGSFTLYDDEGVNYDYEEGRYSIIPLSYNDQDATLTIGERKGTYNGMLKERTFEVRWVSKDGPIGIKSSGKADKVVKYTGEKVIVKKSDQ